VSADGSFVLVIETGTYSVKKYWLTGPQKGTWKTIVANLPGFPDNLSRGRDGRFWLGMISKRVKIVDQLAGSPFLRKMTQRVPQFMRPKAVPYGHVVAFDAEGEILGSYQDPSGAYPFTTGAVETKDYLYISSLKAKPVARISTSKLGLQSSTSHNAD
jgi:sugar lactone lactonase YvrE